MLYTVGSDVSGMPGSVLAVTLVAVALGWYLGMNSAEAKARTRSMGLSGWGRFFPHMPDGNWLLEGAVMLFLTAGIMDVIGGALVAFIAFLYEAAALLMLLLSSMLAAVPGQVPGATASALHEFRSFIGSDPFVYVYLGILGFVMGFISAILIMAIQSYRFEIEKFRRAIA